MNAEFILLMAAAIVIGRVLNGISRENGSPRTAIIMVLVAIVGFGGCWLMTKR